MQFQESNSSIMNVSCREVKGYLYPAHRNSTGALIIRMIIGMQEPIQLLACIFL